MWGYRGLTASVTTTLWVSFFIYKFWVSSFFNATPTVRRVWFGWWGVIAPPSSMPIVADLTNSFVVNIPPLRRGLSA